jgi:putative membrane protein
MYLEEIMINLRFEVCLQRSKLKHIRNMIVTKSISIGRVITWSGHHLVWLSFVMTVIAILYQWNVISFSIPWLPVSVIGTAVAFYVGFKNNQAYDRMWEARKIWGAIVNDSRSWGMLVDGFVSNLFAENKVSDTEIKIIKRRLIYRHIAWLYAHRSQLLAPTPWEHISQGGHMAKFAEMYQQKFGIGLIDEELAQTELRHFLPENEHDRLVKNVNTATQIINEQSRDLAQIRQQGLIEDFRHMEMVTVLKSFLESQGRNERIKRTPLPRQYATMSRYFVGIFIILLPFSMIPELMKVGALGIWLSIPISVLIGWVYVMMEVVADYSENPFQG